MSHVENADRLGRFGIVILSSGSKQRGDIMLEGRVGAGTTVVVCVLDIEADLDVDAEQGCPGSGGGLECRHNYGLDVES